MTAPNPPSNPAPSDLFSYYDTVRSSIHAFDAVRLNCSVAGLTVCIALTSSGIATFLNVGKEKIALEPLIHPIEFQVGALLALSLFAISALCVQQFKLKIQMFSFFIGKAVEIAGSLEEQLIFPPELRLTRQFEKQQYAGERGVPLFIYSLTIVGVFAWIGMAYSLIEFAWSFHRA